MPPKIIILRRHIIDHEQPVKGYFEALQLEASILFLGTRTTKFENETNSSTFIRNENVSTCCRYIRLSKLGFKTNDVITFGKEKNMKIKHIDDDYDFHLLLLDDSALLAATRENEKLPVMTAEMQIEIAFLSSSVLVYSW